MWCVNSEQKGIAKEQINEPFWMSKSIKLREARELEASEYSDFVNDALHALRST